MDSVHETKACGTARKKYSGCLVQFRIHIHHKIAKIQLRSKSILLGWLHLVSNVHLQLRLWLTQLKAAQRLGHLHNGRPTRGDVFLAHRGVFPPKKSLHLLTRYTSVGSRRGRRPFSGVEDIVLGLWQLHAGRNIMGGPWAAS